MGKVVYAEENLLNYLRVLTNENSSFIGFIIGHSTKGRDYVVHMARAIKKHNGDEDNGPVTFNTVKDIKELSITEDIFDINCRLPGGFSVLGTFICSPTDIFSDASLEPTLKKLLVPPKNTATEPSEMIETDLEPDSVLFSSVGSEKLLFHYNPIDQKYICKSLLVGALSNTFKPVDWKFQKNCTKWCEITSEFGFNFPPVIGKEDEKLQNLKAFCSDIEEMLSNAVIVVGGKVLNQEKSLDSLIKTAGKKKVINGTEIQHLTAAVFTPLHHKKVKNNDLDVTHLKFKMRIKGKIRSQAFISQNGTIEDAIMAVKRDISRSWATRFWSLAEKLEEPFHLEEGTMIDFPRRLAVSLPNSPIRLADYIYLGEDVREVIHGFNLMMDLEITEKDVDHKFEAHPDCSSMKDSSPNKLDSTNSNDLLGSKLPSKFFIAAISFAVVLIAIAVALQMQRSVSLNGKT